MNIGRLVERGGGGRYLEGSNLSLCRGGEGVPRETPGPTERGEHAEAKQRSQPQDGQDQK
jgi:hypothetical protein